MRDARWIMTMHGSCWSVYVAAQCTDARVNVVVEGLYAKYPDVNALAEATPEEIEEIVRPCGPVSYTHLRAHETC